ncbi:MAG: DsrE/DsrF/DrsH-like family protein [Rhodospirillales bacterium]|nr:DsrE/DsrF/DrsH-like family protein [Rhodospirillales bacterium]MCW8860972.1 DsrE/DsrF/DrsH-like family protein [Rhodospirillales bacterium]MCW8953093.1 DsrE/DsrF/DrsH-like family protein [Rhodospirillales bacterium]MCW8971612.1 DsrE/DsrF/DrsH-like family protein [Rhodospirillales bacterium]MCW9003327.1 DsrE/DsrF/DrsH-like family protein [Rhodospirillales bacterium]
MDNTPNTAPDKLSLVVYSGDFDKVHYALVMASGAAAIGRDVTVFFTMWASRALLKDGGDGRPGWKAMPVGDPAHADGAALDAVFASRGVGAFEELLEACVAMGATFMVCEMGLRAMGINASDLREDVPFAQGGVVTFLNDASKDGSMLFV